MSLIAFSCINKHRQLRILGTGICILQLVNSLVHSFLCWCRIAERQIQQWPKSKFARYSINYLTAILLSNHFFSRGRRLKTYSSWLSHQYCQRSKKHNLTLKSNLEGFFLELNNEVFSLSHRDSALVGHCHNSPVQFSSNSNYFWLIQYNGNDDAMNSIPFHSVWSCINGYRKSMTLQASHQFSLISNITLICN